MMINAIQALKPHLGQPHFGYVHYFPDKVPQDFGLTQDPNPEAANDLFQKTGDPAVLALREGIYGDVTKTAMVSKTREGNGFVIVTNTGPHHDLIDFRGFSSQSVGTNIKRRQQDAASMVRQVNAASEPSVKTYTMTSTA